MTARMVIAQESDYYLLNTYHFSSNEQGQLISDYLDEAYVPALHSLCFEQVGVFSKIGNDTTDNKQIYILVSSRDLTGLLHIEDALANHDMHLRSGMDYWSTSHDRPVYGRIESSLLGAFKFHKQLKEPKLTSPKAERVYELRSYEAASERLYRKKVEMFNEGGEIDIFNKLNFNAIFYAETLIGAHYPNLVYMTSSENMDERDKHWDAFRAAPAWKELSAKEEYKNTVSKAEIYLLTPMEYSDL
jgi:hypothetical protein